MNDKEWLILLEKSPKKAHYELISEYGGLVYTIVADKLRSCADHEEIKDCVSDAFVEIFKSIGKFDPERGSLKNFVSAISRNTGLNAYHRIGRDRKRLVSTDDETTELPAAADDTELAVDDRMSRDRLWQIVDSLGEPDSSILIYQYIYEMKVQEIAPKVSMTAAAVQKRSIRARAKLKSILEKERSFFHEYA